MTITVSTKKLIDALTDGLQTAYSGVHLATHRGPLGEEPGDVDILSITSSAGAVMGHMWLPCEGQIKSMVWPPDATRTVIAIARSLLARRGKEHTIDIDIVLADPPDGAKEEDHPGWVVTIRESPALFESDTEFQFHAHPGSHLPIDRLGSTLWGAYKERKDYEETPLTVWNPGVLSPLVTIAGRRGARIQFFKSAHTSRVLVQIGDSWLGVAIPSTPNPGTDTTGPSIDPLLPKPPENVLAEMLKNGAGLVTQDNWQETLDGLFSDAPKPKPAPSPEPQLPDDGPEVEPSGDPAELLRQAVELVVAGQFASQSMLARKLKIAPAQAAAFLDTMEKAGIVGPQEGSRARSVLLGDKAVPAALEMLDAFTPEGAGV